MIINPNTSPASAALNKNFTYNMLNLPMGVITPSYTVNYTYDAMGRKLRKVSTNIATGLVSTTDYIGNIQYNNSAGNPNVSTISFIQTEEGKAIASTTNPAVYDYYYYMGDNLGNTRLIFDSQTTPGTTTTIQHDDYYPFGMEINRSVTNPKDDYLYNKKELQEEFTEYDYGARFYDPVIGRWTIVDPYAEKYKSYTAYNFCADNPLKYIDLGGDTIIFNDYTVDHTGLSQTQNLINSGLGGQYATIGANGALTLNVTPDQIGKMTDEQKGFYDVINGVNTDTRGNVDENVTDGSTGVFVGSFTGSEIDIEDINKFGTGDGADKYSTFGHEIKEQQSKQIDKKEYPEAHEDGKKAESTIKGVTRESDLSAEANSSAPKNSDGTLSGTYNIRYTDNKTGKVTTVSINIDHNNVGGVTRQ